MLIAITAGAVVAVVCAFFACLFSVFVYIKTVRDWNERMMYEILILLTTNHEMSQFRQIYIYTHITNHKEAYYSLPQINTSNQHEHFGCRDCYIISTLIRGAHKISRIFRLALIWMKIFQEFVCFPFHGIIISWTPIRASLFPLIGLLFARN